MVLRRILGPSLETGAVLDAALPNNYSKRWACLSVAAVTGVCDEKEAGVRLQRLERLRSPLIAKNTMSGTPGASSLEGESRLEVDHAARESTAGHSKVGVL